MTLSHRWEGLITETVSTTFQNVAERFKSLDSNILPLIFVDAVQVAYQLEVNYLWIDSLCIIQDSTQDWERESSFMANIYQSSYCTIAAEVSDASSLGLFRSADLTTTW